MRRDGRIRDYPEAITVEEVIDETPTVRTLIFSDDIMSSSMPGQFAMVWVPGAFELPMSIMTATGRGRAAFTVRRHGDASTALYNIRRGESIAVRGPYGNSFDVRRGRLLLVGGGTGLVPLMRLVTHANPDDDITILMGARTADEVFFDELASDLLSARRGAGSGNRDDQGSSHSTGDYNCGAGDYNYGTGSEAPLRGRVIVTTDDGTRGKKGRVTDILDAIVDCSAGGKFDAIYTCGPEVMMYKIVQTASRHGIFVQASLERMMKCGVGICGSCAAGPDIVCKDGTIFDGRHLLANPEFGFTYRDKSGIPTSW